MKTTTMATAIVVAMTMVAGLASAHIWKGPGSEPCDDDGSVHYHDGSEYGDCYSIPGGTLVTPGIVIEDPPADGPVFRAFKTSLFA